MDNKKANKKEVKVTYQNGLNIRKEPSKESEIIGVLECSEIVELTAKRNGYGHFDKGWIDLNFTIEV